VSRRVNGRFRAREAPPIPKVAAAINWFGITDVPTSSTTPTCARPPPGVSGVSCSPLVDQVKTLPE
jgi:hypothetical protein